MGYKWTKEQKVNLSKIRKGRRAWNKGINNFLTDEGLKFKRQKMLGNTFRCGKRDSKETIEKKRSSHIGHILCKSAKIKIQQTRLGTKLIGGHWVR